VQEGPIQDLIDELSRLPGIGPKSAQRLAFHLVKSPPDDAKRLAEAIVQAKERIYFCRECGRAEVSCAGSAVMKVVTAPFSAWSRSRRTSRRSRRPG